MDYIILIGVVAVIGLFALVGYKKGMVKIVLSMIAMAVTYILAGALTIPVSMALKTATPVYTTIEESVEKMVKEINDMGTKNYITAIEIGSSKVAGTVGVATYEGTNNLFVKFNIYLFILVPPHCVQSFLVEFP